MKPRFSTLIILTLLTALILVPFALSSSYLPMLRDRAFELHQLILSHGYKQITGFAVLALVFIEMGLVIRKRGRKWKIKVPGSMMLWRSLHIFLGVALIAAVLIHTAGATGLNFNAIFLWVFFAVSLSALLGVVAETGILETDVIRTVRLKMLKRKMFQPPTPGHQPAVPQEQTVLAHGPFCSSDSPQEALSTNGSRNGRSANKNDHPLPPEPIFTPEGTAKLPWVIAALSKGPLIRGLRAIWLSSHIFLVSVFTVMLGFHIFLAYYFQ